MSLILVDTAVVVLAQAHNPTILHPYFLSSEKIVPQDWEPAEPPICTPPFSVLKYRGRFEITAEENKLQFRDSKPDNSVDDVSVENIAERYILSLPHVHYTAVGINFTAFWDFEEPTSFLMERFLQHGPWNEADLTLMAFGLKFVYPVDDAKLNLSVDAGQRKDGPTERKGIVVRGNYDKQLISPQRVDLVVKAIKKFDEWRTHFYKANQRILGFSI